MHSQLPLGLWIIESLLEEIPHFSPPISQPKLIPILFLTLLQARI